MKNEGRIMAEGTGGSMDNRQNEIITNIEPNNGNTGAEKSVEKSGGRKVGKPESLKVPQEEAKKILDDELKKKKIIVGTDKEGKPVEKTVFDVMENARKAIGEIQTIDKWSEKSVEGFSDVRKLVNWSESEDGKKFVESLVNKNVKDDSEKKEVKDVVDIMLKDVWKGDIVEGRKWFESLLDKSRDVKSGESAGVGEFIKDFELNDREQYVLKNMFPSNKPVPAPGEGSGGAGGVRAAPIDGAAVEVGPVIPAPDVKSGIPELPKDNVPSKKERDDLVNKIKTKVKEKGELDWWKLGGAFLFLLICYMGVQSWYAKMWEQFAERAR